MTVSISINLRDGFVAALTALSAALSCSVGRAGGRPEFRGTSVAAR
jgi:hypothetical protein